MTNQQGAQPVRPTRGRKPGFKGVSNREIDYRCTECGGSSTREKLHAKRATFTTVGPAPKTIRVRTVAWLCEVCMIRDPDWNREAHTQAPGNADIYAKPEATNAAAE